MRELKSSSAVYAPTEPLPHETRRRPLRGVGGAAAVAFGVLTVAFAVWAQDRSLIGKEVAIPRHLQDGEEYDLSIPKLIQFGEKLFTAKWTIQEGQGRPDVKGTANGPRLSDPSDPLVFPRNFNRIPGPDSNSCAGCHNEPFVGSGGDRATEVFVLGQRFDFATVGVFGICPQARTLFWTTMCSESASGMSRPSFVRKAALIRYVAAETEKRRKPPVMAIANPV